jgi:hypothetical protein
MLKEFSQRIMHTNTALDELSQSWVRLMILFYFQSRWPLPDGQDPLNDLEGLTGKARPELQDLLQDLGREGALVFREGKIVDFFPDRAWKLYDRPVPVEGS